MTGNGRRCPWRESVEPDWKGPSTLCCGSFYFVLLIEVFRQEIGVCCLKCAPSRMYWNQVRESFLMLEWELDGWLARAEGALRKTLGHCASDQTSRIWRLWHGCALHKHFKGFGRVGNADFSKLGLKHPGWLTDLHVPSSTFATTYCLCRPRKMRSVFK